MVHVHVIFLYVNTLNFPVNHVVVVFNLPRIFDLYSTAQHTIYLVYILH